MIVRELIHLVSFRLNRSSVAAVEAQVKRAQNALTLHKPRFDPNMFKPIGDSIEKDVIQKSRRGIQSLRMLAASFIAAPLFNFGKGALEAHYNLQTLMLSLKAYETTPGEAKNTYNELIALATKLPTVQIEDLNKSIGSLVTRGIPLKDLVQTFKSFSVITGATGGSVKGLTKAFTDSFLKGKLAGQEMNQFVNASVPLMQGLMKSMGLPGAKIIELQKAGKVSFEEIRKAINLLAADEGAFANIMNEKTDMSMGMLKTLADLWYVVKTDLGEQIDTFLTPLIPQLEKVVVWLGNLSDTWKRMAVEFMGFGALAGVITAVIVVLGPVLDIVLAIAAGVVAISAAFDDIYVWTKGGDSILGDIFGDFSQYEPEIKKIGTLLFTMFTSLIALWRDSSSILTVLFQTISGDKSVTALTAFLKILEVMLSTVNMLILGLRQIGLMPQRVQEWTGYGPETYSDEWVKRGIAQKQLNKDVANNSIISTLFSPFYENFQMEDMQKNGTMGRMSGADTSAVTDSLMQDTVAYKGARASAALSSDYGASQNVNVNAPVEVKIINAEGMNAQDMSKELHKTLDAYMEQTARSIFTNSSDTTAANIKKN